MKRKLLLGFQISIFLIITIVFAAALMAADEWVVPSNTTKTVNSTTKLSKLTIQDNAILTAPDGYRLTLTVDGVETGQVLKTWEGVDYKFSPGTYKGDIVLTVSKANDVVWTGAGGGPSEGGAPGGGAGGFGAGMPDFYPFRQALYLDINGIDGSKSVLAAVKGKKPAGFEINNIEIKSVGTSYKDSNSPGGTGFNGIYAAGGEYNLKNIKIDFVGDGRSDFVAAGTAIVAAGKGTKLVLENVDIRTRGIVRSGVIAKEESNVIVKNSKIDVKNGLLPPDYESTMNISQMRSTLWISGMTGTTRATSILGTGTKATYINTSISFEGWGGLSTDIGNASKLTVINSKIYNTGTSGYGQYNNSSAITKILGCEFNVGTLGSGMDSGSLFLGDSTPEAVKALNEELGLGLTPKELASIPVKHTVINSGYQGMVWHGNGGNLTITGGTLFNTKATLFINKGVRTDIQADGSQGAQLNSGNGIIMQVMDDDEPPRDSKTNNFLDYEEPTGPVKKDDAHDIYTSKESDSLAKFSNIQLKGDFYNAVRGGPKNSIMGGIVSGSKNLMLTFSNAGITGVISAADALHYYNGKYFPKIGKSDFKAFSAVVNMPSPAVNNGVIVTLTNGSKWTVTGTSYLTKLVVEKGASVAASSGRALSMTVDGGQPITSIPAGEYKGNIVITVK
jgi:hypothetical protein